MLMKQSFRLAWLALLLGPAVLDRKSSPDGWLTSEQSKSGARDRNDAFQSAPKNLNQ